MGQIGIRDGDNASELAEMFVRAFRLDPKFTGRLAHIIVARVKDYAGQLVNGLMHLPLSPCCVAAYLPPHS